jgi:hypothetical protein
VRVRVTVRDEQILRFARDDQRKKREKNPTGKGGVWGTHRVTMAVIGEAIPGSEVAAGKGLIPKGMSYRISV